MTYKKINNPKELVAGKIYSDTNPILPFATLLKFEKLDKENTMYFRHSGGERKYLSKKGLIAFENDFDDNDYPFFELP
jgi:hypothetical protein